MRALGAGLQSPASGGLLAVIIAAGQATRLQPYSLERPKSLMELAPKVTIIDFILKRLQEVGVRRAIIVTRPEHRSTFEAHLEGRAEVVTVDKEGAGNLHSLETAFRFAGDQRILLVMSDHVFEISLLRRLIEADDGSKRVLLCLDTSPDHRSLHEGLRVDSTLLDVQRVGKAIRPHSGVDTGLFILSPEFRQIVSRLTAEDREKSALSDLVNDLAREGQVGCVDVSGRLWIDVDTPEDLLKARQLYPKIMRRDLCKPTDGPISRWLNRPISSRLSIFVFNHVPWVTPNLLTATSFLIALAAASLFVTGQLLIGAVLVHLSSILDGADGELARLRDTTTPFGSLLDSVLDRAADVSLLLALGSLLPPNPVDFVLTGLAVFGAISVSYISHLSSQYIDVSKLRTGFPWATRDVRLFSMTVGGLILQPILPICFCVAAPLAYATRVLASAARIQTQSGTPARTRLPAAAGPEPGIQLPKQKPQPSQIRGNIESLLVNLLKAAVAIIVLQLVWTAVERTNQRIEIFLPPPLDIDLIFDLARLIIAAYFGYRVLLSTRYFADMATDLVVARLQITRGMYARVTTDVLYLIAVLVSWSVVSPVAAKLPHVGGLLTLPTSLVFLGLTLLLLYDLLRIANRGLRWLWDAAIERLTEWLTTHFHRLDEDDLHHDQERLQSGEPIAH